VKQKTLALLNSFAKGERGDEKSGRFSSGKGKTVVLRKKKRCGEAANDYAASVSDLRFPLIHPDDSCW
jgi:hypothetical protein